MNRPNDLLPNLLLTPLCFLAILGILILGVNYSDLLNSFDERWELLIGLALVVGMLIAHIAGIRFLVICVVTIFYLIRKRNT